MLSFWWIFAVCGLTCTFSAWALKQALTLIPFLFLISSYSSPRLMGAMRYSTCPWYWFTLVKKVSGYMVVTNPLRRMRTVCLRKDACLNLLYVVLSFCSWSLATTGILRALLEYLGVTCSHRESELGISHLQQAPSPWPKPPHLCKALSRSLSVHCAHVDFGGDFQFSQPVLRFGDVVDSQQHSHFNSAPCFLRFKHPTSCDLYLELIFSDVWTL